jgi:hypothetical protein
MYQLALKSLDYPIAFQAEYEGSIPFTRSNLFNDLRDGALDFCINWAAGLRHCAAIWDCNLCREELPAIALADTRPV